MTVDTAVADADKRWQLWMARKDAGDRRTMKTMTGVLLVLALAIGIWLSVTLVVY
jgi:hypothetical protein